MKEFSNKILLSLKLESYSARIQIHNILKNFDIFIHLRLQNLILGKKNKFYSETIRFLPQYES